MARVNYHCTTSELCSVEHSMNINQDNFFVNYQRFIAGKFNRFLESGFGPNELPYNLFDFQTAIVKWACRRGRAAIWADTGLGKTAMQVAWADQVTQHTGRDVLILAPLCVAQQTVLEAQKFGIDVFYARNQSECFPGINITNYERLDNFDLNLFGGIVLDESSILKSMTGRTRQKIIDASKNIVYKLSCTATPSPNDHIELGNQSEFLGIMSAAEMLAMFFIHDGGSTQNWRLKGHGAAKFWQWVASWAIAIKNPADIGFDGASYELPPINIVDHIVDYKKPVFGELFEKPVQSLSDRRTIARESIEIKTKQLKQIVSKSSDQWVIWCHTNDESTAATNAIDGAVEIVGSDNPEKKEQAILDFLDGKTQFLVSKPSIFGFGINMQNCHNTVFFSITDSHESLYQAMRRFYRFGQQHIVNVHLIYTKQEQPIKSNLEKKQAQADEMSGHMVKHMAVFSDVATKAEKNITTYQPSQTVQIPQWLQEESQ